jgi:P-type E1-E2 ATPase
MVDAGPDHVSGMPRALSYVPCATCGTRTDPLRAARVAMFDDKFRYFCSAECRTRYDAAAGRTPLPLPRPRTGLRADALLYAGGDDIARSASRRAAKALEAVEGDRISELGSARRDAMNLDVSAGDRVSDLGSRIVSLDSPESLPPAPVEVPAPTDVGSMLIAISLVAGALSAALVLVGPSPIALTARLVLVLVATGSFVAHAFTTTDDASELHPVAASAAPIGAALVALVARLGDHPLASEATGFAGVLVSTLAVIVWLLDRAGHPIQVERALVRHGLMAPGHRIVGDDVTDASYDDLRPGEEIVVEAGEVVPVDATVVAGRAAVHAWLGATGTVVRDEGDSIVAGARVVEGRLRAIVGWAGNDRAYMRLTHDPRRRAAVFAPLASFGRSVATRGSIVAAVVAALAAFSGDRDLLIIALYAVAAHAAFANRAVAQIAALHVEDTVLAALRRGVIFRTADALDRAGKVSTAAFCARGTLLLGEPEVANIEAFGAFEPDAVLGYIAGTESGASRPTAVAIQRAARARGIRPDGVRSPVNQPGLGVTAVASSGQTLVVGSRGLMMRERISVALAESKIADLEAMGRTVMLVALGGKLMGLIGLHDGLRPGARAAVQHLLDSGIEPVLLSGDTRDTCEALGRAVDIDHIRPEVLPQDRGDEIRRLADGGAIVAVLGRSPNDDVALAAADVSVALDSGGGSAAEWSVQLASDDVRDGAFALRLAHACRRGAGFGLAWAIGPSFAAALLMCVGLAPLASPPLVALAGAAVAVARLRSRR